MAQRTLGESGPSSWATARTLDEVADLCDGQRDSGILGDTRPFWMTLREGELDSVRVADVIVGVDMWMDCGDERTTYNITLPVSGHIEATHRGSLVTAGVRNAVVYQPEGELLLSRWAAESRAVIVRFDRVAVEAALFEAVGRRVASPIDFAPAMVDSPAARHWADMVMMLTGELLRADGLFKHPMVGLPFVESLVRGLLIAADHPDRGALIAESCNPAPRYLRTAVEIIEAEAHLPLTVTSVAARSYISVRALQDGFRRHLQTSPMAFLRGVRLRRAHQALVAGDPSVDTVTSIGYRWGFTNAGRFIALHTAHYGESPGVTLRRT